MEQHFHGRLFATAHPDHLGAGDELAVTEAERGTRFMRRAGKPYGETPVFNGPYVD